MVQWKQDLNCPSSDEAKGDGDEMDFEVFRFARQATAGRDQEGAKNNINENGNKIRK